MALFASILPIHLVLLLLGLVFAYVFLVPLVTLATFRHEANVTIQLIDSSMPLPKDVAPFMKGVGVELEQLGFDEYCTVLLPHPTNNVRMIVKLFVHRPNRDCAMAASALVGIDDVWKVQSQFVEFNTRFQSDAEINTGNPDEVSSFTPPANTITTHAPWLTSMNDLYRAHCMIINSQKSKEPKVLSLESQFGGSAVAFLADGIQRELHHEQTCGRLVLTDQNRFYRTGFIGAYLYTWKNVPPMKQFFQLARNARSRKTLQYAGF